MESNSEMRNDKLGFVCSKKNNKQRLEVVIFDGCVSITRNFTESSVIPMGEQKGLLALLDAIGNPGKYEIQIHDSRKNDVYSAISYEII